MQKPTTAVATAQTGASVFAGVRGYGMAILCLGLALLLRFLLDSEWNDRLPYASFFLAVLAIAQLAEIGPSLFTVIAGFLLGDWFFNTPRHSLLISDPINRFNTAFYFVVCFGVLFFSARTRRARSRERAARAALAMMAAIVESSDDAIIGKSLNGIITSWNGGAQHLYGYSEAEAIGRSITFLFPPDRTDDLTPLLERVGRGERVIHFETTRLRKDGSTVEVSLSISPVRNSRGEVVGASTIARDISERKQAERERERLMSELQRALGDVKTLKGLLPICSHCKKIRDDKGYWNQIELYVRKHSDASFTHSICPDCAKDFYPDLFNKKQGPFT